MIHCFAKNDSGTKLIQIKLQLNLEAIHAESRQLDNAVKKIMNGNISNDILQVRWPLGVPSPSMPDTRHDLLAWSLMNETHQIMPNAEENVKLLSKIDHEDVKVWNVSKEISHLPMRVVYSE